MNTKSIPKKKKTSKAKPQINTPWRVLLFNDDVHSFDEVILQVQKAIGCSILQATKITLEAHQKGKAVVYTGEFSDCHRVANILREIELIVEIRG